jgi:hypothetical protein
MPKGIPKKKVVEEAVDTTDLKHPVSENVEEKKEVKAEVKESKDETKKKEKERVLEPLQPGFKYFEAPDGTVIIGEADKQQVFYRAGNCWINPKR